MRQKLVAKIYLLKMAVKISIRLIIMNKAVSIVFMQKKYS